MTEPAHTEHPEPLDVALVDVPAVRSLVNACGPGWTVRLTRAVGPLDAQHNEDGHRVVVTETVDSILAVLRHPDRGGAVALWVRRPDRRDPAKPSTGYGFDFAIRARGEGEHGPVMLGATELKAHVAPAAGEVEPDLELDLGLGVAA